MQTIQLFLQDLLGVHDQNARTTTACLIASNLLDRNFALTFLGQFGVPRPIWNSPVTVGCQNFSQTVPSGAFNGGKKSQYFPL